MIDSNASALLATIAVELAVVAAMTRGNRPKDLMLIVLCANLLTHPIASSLVHGPWLYLGFWPTEMLIIAAESIIYIQVAGLNIKPSCWLAMTSNGSTIVLSLLFL
ncbi:MAG: hypothetical protein JKY61_06645 [Planctomycetes bacterium]|nr:hypothetical protein [Planctomycetota bacterium]